MSIPKSVTELKAFLGCTQQMSQYCRYYGIVASPLHRLTRVTEPFLKHWLPGTDYDIAFHRIKSMMLDESLFLWNKDSTKRLYIEVDACNEGWGACAYQYADSKPLTLKTKADTCSCPNFPNESLNGSARHGLNLRRSFPSSIARLLRDCSA